MASSTQPLYSKHFIPLHMHNYKSGHPTEGEYFFRRPLTYFGLFQWMFAATDDNQQLTVYRALFSIIQNKKVLNKLVGLNIIDAACQGLNSAGKKGVVTHALKLLIDIVKTPDGVKSAKDKKVADLVKKTIAKHDNDPVLQHLGSQVIEQLK